MRFALAYLDDVLIFLPCIDSHFDHLWKIFKKIENTK